MKELIINQRINIEMNWLTFTKNIKHIDFIKEKRSMKI